MHAAPTRVAILEARMSAELARLFARAGMRVRSAPAVREEALDCAAEVATFIDGLSKRALTLIVFMTGVGVKALLAEADKLGRRAELLAVLGTTTNVCRGPKPVAALRQSGLPVAVVAREPQTLNELLEALAPLVLDGIGVGVLHYGERSGALAEALRARGARLFELCLYEWRMPLDERPLRDLVGEIIAGDLDVVAFTSQIQARHLFQVAEEAGRADALRSALTTHTRVASIGPTCTAALNELGLRPAIEPVHPKMGHLVQAIAAVFEDPGPL